MKKNFLFLFLLFCWGGNVFAVSDDLANYRYNPFQFPYPEYYYKAEIIDVQSSTTHSKGLKEIDFFGLSAHVPERYAETVDHKSESQIVVKSGKGLFLINKEEEKLMGCMYDEVKANNRDFCSAFTSTQDFFFKLFTLTPYDCEASTPTGILWILHRKGLIFDQAKKICIYKGDGFTAFVQERKERTRLRKGLFLFHEKLPPDYYISMGTTITDDDFIKEFLETLNAK